MNLDNEYKITQYVLDEMDDKEKRNFEKELEKDKQLQQEVNEFKQIAMMLNETLAEPSEVEKLRDEQKELLNQEMAKVVANPRKKVLIRFVIPFAAMFAIIASVIIMNLGDGIKFSKDDIEVVTKATQVEETKNILEPPSTLMINEEFDDSVIYETSKKMEKLSEKPVLALETVESDNIESKLADVASVTTKANSLVSKRKKKAITKKLKSMTGYSRGTELMLARNKMKRRIMPVVKEEMKEVSLDNESYSLINENRFKNVIESPLSTFSIDVDTASYSNIRRFLKQGMLPPRDSVRVEECINYFSYNYKQPKDKPFSVRFESSVAPWNKEHRLVMIGLKGKTFNNDKRPASNLVFLLDVSGSMDSQNKLPLLKKAFKLLVKQLGENDRVAIVVYAGAAGVVLDSITADHKEKILTSLSRLNAGGSTNGGEGIELAYKIAIKNFIEGGNNRVILATDGDFNVGKTDESSLLTFIKKKAKSGVFLSVFGFGMGNYKDSMLEKLADNGNGNYGYIDNLNEAKKVFVTEMGATLHTIAKDVKLQVEFNPKYVKSYRLIGYENRKLAKEDFNNDKKDAGEIGAGHTVTAFYELVLNDGKLIASVDLLRYQTRAKVIQKPDVNNELMMVKIRYKEHDGAKSKLLKFPLANKFEKFSDTTVDFKFACSVIEFALLLRNSQFKGDATFEKALGLAEQGLEDDKYGYRKEFIKLVKMAKRLSSANE